MEVVVTTGAITRAKLQSNHHHQQTNIHFFYRPDALPVAQPTVSEHWRENITFHGLAYSKITRGLPTLSLSINILDFIGAKDDAGGGDNWSYNQIVTTNKPTPNFLQAGCPSSRRTNSVRALSHIKCIGMIINK